MGVSRPCSLAALGMVNALGASPDAIWPRILAADQSGLRRRSDLIPGRSLLVAEVPGPLPPCPPALSRYACRNNSLSLAAFEQIEPAVRQVMTAIGPERIGIVIGSSTSGIAAAEAAMATHLRTELLPEGFDYARVEFGGAAAFLAEYAGIAGPAYTISTACSSGARFPCAFLEALGLLADGTDESVLLVVGDEPLPPVFARFADDPPAAYAAAFLLAGADSGPEAISVDAPAHRRPPFTEITWPVM